MQDVQQLFVQVEAVPQLRADLEQSGFKLYVIDAPKNAKEFISLVGGIFPLNPPLSKKSIHWDAFADSLGGGLIDCSDSKIALIINDATAFRDANELRLSMPEFEIAMHCLLKESKLATDEKQRLGQRDACIRVVVGIDERRDSDK